tara:strand:- start:427 stop:1809 length:1383 start_codon:yes stop_codon:yes gene_type:complete
MAAPTIAKLVSRSIQKFTRPARKHVLRAFRRIFNIGNGIEYKTARKRAYWDDIASLTLSNLVHETETQASGRIQVIALTDFRASIGDLWDKYKDRIVLIADSTIGKMIGRGNTYIPQDDDTWILLMPGLPEAHAQALTDSIATAIGDKLMGAKFAPHEAPFPATAKLDLSNAINPDGSVNVDALKAEVAKVRRIQDASMPLPPVRNLRPSLSSSRLSPPVRTTRASSSYLTPMLMPAWSSDTESIDSFFFRAFTEENTNVFQDAASPMNRADALNMIRTASSIFHEAINASLRIKLTVPVPFALLQEDSRSHIQSSISKLPQRERLLQFRLEIVQIPSSVGAEALVGIRETFRPFVRDIAFSTDPMSPHEQILALDHIIVGGELSPNLDIDDERLFQALLHFRHRAGRRTTYLLGLNSRTQIGAALRAGIHEVGGRGLADGQRRLPIRLTLLRRDELLSH